MAGPDEANIVHVISIKMYNWGIFPGETHIEFPIQPNSSVTKDSLIAFIGPNNTGKTLVLSSLDKAAKILKSAVGDTADSGCKGINKFEKNEEGIFSVQMTGNVTFGLYSPKYKENWNWNENDGPKPCVCFLIFGSNLYLVRHTSGGYQIIKDNDQQEEQEEVDCFDETFCDIVRRVLPCCVVEEKSIRDIYSGCHVGDHIDGMRSQSPNCMIDVATKQEFVPYDIPSGHKFLGFTKAVMEKMMGENPRKRCLVMEEPTRCMHPTMIREFVFFLHDQCRINNMQVIFSTHAPTAVENLVLSQVFLFSRVKNIHAEVRCVLPKDNTEGNKEGQKHFYLQRFFFPCLFARCCILVEGPSDRQILERALNMILNDENNKETKGSEEDKSSDGSPCSENSDRESANKAISKEEDGIHFRNSVRDSVVVSVDGKTNFANTIQRLERLSIPYSIICDGDTIFGCSAGKMKNILESFDIEKHPFGDLAKMLSAKRCRCSFGLKIASNEIAEADPCKGVSKSALPKEEHGLKTAEDVWTFAEEHDIFAISRTGRHDLESWIENEKKLKLGLSDSEVNKILERTDKGRLIAFMRKFAKRLSADDKPDVAQTSSNLSS